MLEVRFVQLLCHRRIFKSLGQVRAECCQCILCSVVATCGPGVLQRVTMLKGSWQLFGYIFQKFSKSSAKGSKGMFDLYSGHWNWHTTDISHGDPKDFQNDPKNARCSAF